MKRLIYGSLFLATVGIVILACKKEAMSPVDSIVSAKNTTIVQKQKGEITQSNEKSTGNGGLDSMAQAADFRKISYVSSIDSYLIESYDDTLEYFAKINTFFIDSLVKMKIKKGSTIYNVTIDVQLETIVISGIGSYTFSNYYDSYGLTDRSGRVKNIVAVMVPYYALYPNTTTSWTDNGDGDVYNPAIATPRRFWGRSKANGPCNEMLHYYTEFSDYYVSWIAVGSMHVETQHPC
ncbi:MAG: hypothetical protein ABI207_08620 [Crocinitomicaceae bacterium]